MRQGPLAGFVEFLTENSRSDAYIALARENLALQDQLEAANSNQHEVLMPFNHNHQVTWGPMFNDWPIYIGFLAK